MAKVVPHNEKQRQDVVRRYDILDTPPDGAFERLTQLAGRIFNVPIAIITVVDEDRIWFKSKLGLDVSEVGREPGLCASCIIQDEVLVINDAKKDAVALTNPLVASDFGLRFYAGAPLRTHDGFNIGTFCLVAREPREFSDAERATLADLAAIVMDEMELRLSSRRLVLSNQELLKEAEHKANTDALTGLGNRWAFERDCAELESLLKNGHLADLMVVVIDLNGLKKVNDAYGHTKGDYLIQTYASFLLGSLRQSDRAYRLGGDEFALLIPLSAPPDFEALYYRLKSVTQAVRAETGFAEAGAAFGLVAASEANGSIYTAFQQADRKMYGHKRGKNSGISV